MGPQQGKICIESIMVRQTESLDEVMRNMFSSYFYLSHLKGFCIYLSFLYKGEIASTSDYALRVIQENRKEKECSSNRFIITK